ncbi:tyrosine-type recombinase/integrase [Geodermatophilus sp. YIM 151500]|nr:tyrosine-type recombinase/integrase [Geodermatophilus sp. YIM 151500]
MRWRPTWPLGPPTSSSSPPKSAAPSTARVFRSRLATGGRRAGLSGVNMHSLRHSCASLLIRHGESVKTVQARLSHASAAETLDTYSHLWPDSDDRTRAAVDAVLGRVADSLRTDAVH